MKEKLDSNTLASLSMPGHGTYLEIRKEESDFHKKKATFNENETRIEKGESNDFTSNPDNFTEKEMLLKIYKLLYQIDQKLK